MNHTLLQMIREGEHLKLDFKFCITDSRKIARSLVAFANTEGGSLLIGVKDNGSIVGVQSDEEYYMAEAAAKIYAKPPILFFTKQWHYEAKTVLQIRVHPSPDRPHFAKDEEGRWLAYVRYNDENRLAGKVMIDAWNKEKRNEGITIKITEADRFLLQYLDEHAFITVSAFARKASLPIRQAEQILSDYIALGIVHPYFGGSHVLYQLNASFDLDHWMKDNSLEMRFK